LFHFAKWSRPLPLALAAMAALVVTGCASANAPSAHASSRVVTFAEQPSAPPNYIFPLESGAYFTFANGQFSPLLYLPLYSFGDAGKPVFNRSLSVAEPPVFSDGNTLVTVTLKRWRWSNGSPITARDVIFWMNLLSAATDPGAPAVGSNSAPGPGWGASVPGGFPENVVSYRQTGTYTVSFKLNAAYNPTWFLYNELSQVYPIPAVSWDRLSSTSPNGDFDAGAEVRVPLAGTSPAQYVPQNPGTGSSGALGVAQFLNSQSQATETYQSNPLWKVVDGPFELSQFTTSGFVKLVPNPDYSGSPKPKISAFEELPYTSAAAEFDAVHSGSVTIGYIPSQDLGSQLRSLERTEGYSYSPWYTSAFNALDFNFTNPTMGPIFKQLYFRQALQSLINQPEYIKDFNAGVGTITNGPVPGYPPDNADESSLEAKGLVYPFSPSRAAALLRSNGWTVELGGTSFCARAGTAEGQCGAGIKAHTPLMIQLLYPSGSPSLDNEMAVMKSTMQKDAGIDIQLREEPVNEVTGVVSAGCTSASPCSDWQLATEANTGVSWVYDPDYLPTGGELFLPGSNSNQGDYSSATANALIAATHTAPTAKAEIQALFNYENFLARSLPVAWLPTSPYQLTVYKSNLQGLVPQGIFSEVTPQYYQVS